MILHLLSLRRNKCQLLDFIQNLRKEGIWQSIFQREDPWQNPWKIGLSKRRIDFAKKYQKTIKKLTLSCFGSKTKCFFDLFSFSLIFFRFDSKTLKP